MVNENRIVPVEKIDLLTLLYLIMKAKTTNVSGTLEVLPASTIDGDFDVPANSKFYVANQPVKSLTYGSSVTGSTVLFVADYHFEGFSKTGATLTITKPEEGILADGHTIYCAGLANNAVTVTKWA